MPHASPHKPSAALAPRPGLGQPFLQAAARPSPLLPLLLALLSAALLPRGAWASFSCYSCTSCGFTYCNNCRSTSFSGSTCSVSCLDENILSITRDVGTVWATLRPTSYVGLGNSVGLFPWDLLLFIHWYSSSGKHAALSALLGSSIPAEGVRECLHAMPLPPPPTLASACCSHCLTCKNC